METKTPTENGVRDSIVNYENDIRIRYGKIFAAIYKIRYIF